MIHDMDLHGNAEHEILINHLLYFEPSWFILGPVYLDNYYPKEASSMPMNVHHLHHMDIKKCQVDNSSESAFRVAK